MPYRRKRPALDPCPVETVLAIVAGKWKVRVLYLLSLDELSFGELRNSIGGVRQQVLSSLLRDLIADGAIWHRKESPERSTYGLTAKGRELVALLTPIAAWGIHLLAEQGATWQPPAPQRRSPVREAGVRQ
ncbi:helix-turn-helix transcriptional regulator [Bradyrhizobium jicamae]|uniref:Helix-turn-helix transcriptional regulator n=1 Tax=Bradyrhizobium jicamae TaxID=280332 RepID=A0ABS5FJ79_9BRAD|nr:helix-turn-helix domain-containing protein [Bradyrhizobium jicamae]MBR0796840.1 helix-turn-helix transcriptional regulator [Bradyrhizobium jicamae]MBR0935275.1 helix-turn-helix transcriptional regulator [Bradyrhizobium jicamae]